MQVAIYTKLSPKFRYDQLIDFDHIESTPLMVVEWAPAGRVGKNQFQASIDEADVAAVDSCTYHD